MAESVWDQLFGKSLIDKEEGKQKSIPSSSLDGKHVAVYFSAHWCVLLVDAAADPKQLDSCYSSINTLACPTLRCPPCRQFTPQLAKTYAKLTKDGKDFEVVFVSMDKNQAQFDVSANSACYC